MAFAVRSVDGGVSFAVRVQPGASRECILGTYGDSVRIALAAPAVDGRANDALVRCLAEVLGVPRRSVEIASGLLSRAKIVRVMGVTADEATVKLTRIESA